MIDVPRIYLRDNTDKIVSALDAGDYKNDTLKRYLAGKASIFTMTIPKKVGDYDRYQVGRKLSFRYEDEDFWLNILISEQNETDVKITALSLNLEYNNEIIGPYSATNYTFKQYFDNMLNIDYSITIGINEVSDKKISNTWDGSSTLLERLFSLATVFDAEIEFTTSLNDDGSLKSIVMNVYKEHSDTYQGMGSDRRNKIFRFGPDITTISKKEDITTLYTAIRPNGAEGLSIKDVEHEVRDADGTLLYATYKEPRLGFHDIGKLYAPQSRDRFPSTVLGDTDKWTVYYTPETEFTDGEALYAYALGELKKNSVPSVEWTIEGYIEGRVGDTIMVEDEGYKPTLYIQARITEQELHFTEPNLNKTTFGNVKELKSKVSSDLLSDVQKLIDANKVYTCGIATDNGTIFKNGEGETTLTATVRDGAVDVTDKFTVEWFKDGTFLDTGAEITVNASDVDGKSVYKFVAKKADETVAGMYEVTVTDVSDGNKGDDAILLHVTSVNGNIFKNTGVSTTLTVTIYVGDTQIDTQQKLINYFGPQAFLQWRVKRIHELSYTAIPLDDHRLSDGGFIFTLNVDDIDEKATFACDLDF